MKKKLCSGQLLELIHQENKIVRSQKNIVGKRGKEINPDKNLFLCLVSKCLWKLIILVLPSDVNAKQVLFFFGGGGGCFKCTYLNGTADYFLVPLCMIGFFHNRHGTGRESCPFISSLTQPFSEARQQIHGGWEGVEANAKRGV